MSTIEAIAENYQTFDPAAYLWEDFTKRSKYNEGAMAREAETSENGFPEFSVNIHQPCPLGSELGPGTVDALVSSFCPNYPTIVKALRNITGLHKPGGHVLMIGALEHTSWRERPGSRWLALEEMTRKAFYDVGYVVRDSYTMPESMKVGVDDVKGISFVWAQKKESD